MRHIEFPDSIDTIHRRLPFFLATEEWAARHLPAGDYFFSWQVDPTVICGRNQEINKEVNLDYCRREGIDVVRRRSGGGAVFADRENFMFSYITSGNDVVGEFAKYTSMIASALQRLGINAIATGRNDITIDGKKVSGNAFYHIPGRCIAHGTMLYHFDPRHIANALTPSKAKLESKGVKSVQSRVTCLQNEGISLSPKEFEEYMIRSITDGNPHIVSEADLRKIEEIEERYYDPAFLKIDITDAAKAKESISAAKSFSNQTRLDGIGEFCIEYTIDEDNRIRNFSISGDFFMSEDVEERLIRRIEATICDRKHLTSAISAINPGNIIPGLTAEILINLIFPNTPLD